MRNYLLLEPDVGVHISFPYHDVSMQNVGGALALKILTSKYDLSNHPSQKPLAAMRYHDKPLAATVMIMPCVIIMVSCFVHQKEAEGGVQ